MGGFAPQFTSIAAPNLGGSGSGTLPPPPPTMTTPSAGAPSGTGTSTPYGGFSFAAGGALPGTNTNMTTPTMDPALTNALLGYLGGNLGQGLPAFNQSVALPSGGMSTPGSLTAPENPILQQLQQFMTGGGNAGSLPGVLPMWQSEMAAMQQPIQQNLAQLREQFGSMGALGSSEMANAQGNYLSQTSADENSLLTQATMQSLSQMTTTGMDIQGLDQAAISNAYQQFQTDLPQNNPLMGDIMSMGMMSPGGSYTKQPSTLQSVLANISPILSSLGGAADSATGGQLPGWLTSLLGT